MLPQAALHWCFRACHFAGGDLWSQSGGASAGVSTTDPVVQNIACTAGIQRAFLLYGTVRGASGALVEQKTSHMSYTCVDEVCPFSEVGREVSWREGVLQHRERHLSRFCLVKISLLGWPLVFCGRSGSCCELTVRSARHGVVQADTRRSHDRNHENVEVAKYSVLGGSSKSRSLC